MSVHLDLSLCICQTSASATKATCINIFLHTPLIVRHTEEAAKISAPEQELEAVFTLLAFSDAMRKNNRKFSLSQCGRILLPQIENNNIYNTERIVHFYGVVVTCVLFASKLQPASQRPTNTHGTAFNLISSSLSPPTIICSASAGA